jgi:hypothetical protein
MPFNINILIFGKHLPIQGKRVDSRSQMEKPPGFIQYFWINHLVFLDSAFPIVFMGKCPPFAR